MSKITTVKFVGASGTKYDFDVYHQNSSFRDVGAVYVLSKRTVSEGKGMHKALYVGESAKLGTRLANHEKWQCAIGHGVNVICVRTTQGSDHRLKIEADLRKSLKPPCNNQ